MAKRKQQSNTPRRQTERRGSPGPFSWLLLWPFHLLFALTRGMSAPIRIPARLAGVPAVAGLYFLVVLAVIYGIRSSGYDLSTINRMPERTIILDRQGTEIGRIHGEKRDIVPLDEVAGDFRKAILAREDERFYSHGAIDIIGIGRAILKNLEGKREGASTITQQLASDVFQLKYGEKRGDLPRQLDRKMLEIAIAFRLESALTKDQILEAYINQINWGRQIKGVGEASRIYFEKHPEELTLSESALLAGIVRGTDAYNPFRSMEAAERERNTTLARMVTAEKISQTQADGAKKEPITVRPAWRRDSQQSYAMDAIRRDLELILERENIQIGGLTIVTTIDQRLQTIAENALDKKLRETERLSGYPHQTRAAWQKIPEAERKDPQYIQGSAVLMENRTGAVIALVGGRDANESQFNRAIQARRQIGSIFKPFVYLAAFDKGLLPTTPISDGPIRRGEIKGAPTWKPNNSDGKFGGMNPVSYGLIRSRNTMSVRVGNYAGVSKVADVSKNGGLRDGHAGNALFVSRFLGGDAMGGGYRIHDFPQRWQPIPPLSDLRNQGSRRQHPLHHPSPFLPGCEYRLRMDGLENSRAGRHHRHRRLRETPRLRQGRRGENRNNQRLQGRLVRRIHLLTHMRRLGRLRPTEKDHTGRLRIHTRPPCLGGCHEDRRPPRLQGRRPPLERETRQH